MKFGLKPLQNMDRLADFCKIEALRSVPWYLSALLVSLGVACLFAYIETEWVQWYFSQYPFAGESFSYYWSRLQTAQAVAEYGRGVVFDLAPLAPKDPLKIWFIGLMPMSMMTRVEGTILYNALCYVPFAFMLAHTVRVRTGLKYFALATTTVLGAMYVFVEPLSGFASERPDLPAAFLTGAAMLALLASERGDRPVWFIWFAVFTSLATLVRISASLYVFVLCAPLCAAYLWRVLRVHGAKRVGWIVAGMVLVLAVLIGDFFARWLLPLLEFYRVAGYADGAPITAAWSTTVTSFFKIGLGASFAVLFLTAAAWITQSRLRGIDFWSALESLWLLLAVPLLIVFVMGLEGDHSQMFYMIPALALCVFAPLKLRRSQTTHRHPRMITAGLPVLTLVVVAAIAWTNFNAERSPSGAQVERRSFQQDLTEALVAADDWHRRTTGQDDFIFEVAFNYAWRFVIPAAQHSFSRNLKNIKSFEVRRAQWFEWMNEYRFLPMDIIQEIFLNRIDLEIDAFAVLADPEAPEALGVLVDEYTIKMAAKLRDHLKSPDTPWFKLSEVDGPYGRVEVYLNPHKAKTDAFRKDLAERARQSLHDNQARLIEGAPAQAALALSFEPDPVPVSVLPVGSLRRQVRHFMIYPTSVDSVAADGTPYVEPVTPDDILLAVRSTHERLLETASVVVLPENPHEPRLQPLLSTALSSQALDLLQDLMLGAPSRWEPHAAITTSRGNFSVFVNRDYLRM